MKRFITLLTAVLLVSVSLPCLAGSQDATSSPSASIVKGNSAFAADLYGKLGATAGNLFFSPYSISSALGMTYAGARGNTAREMKGALHFTLDQEKLHPAFKALNRELTASADKTGQKLNIANGLVLTGGNVSANFKEILKDNYAAEIFPGQLTKINGWVKRKTGGKIDRILEELSPNSVCVLLNAIYFKGEWESRFKKSDTREALFKVSADSKVKVPLMYQEGRFKHLDGGDFQAVSLPYKGNSLSMVVLLPNEVDGLASLEKQLTDQRMAEWLAELDRGTPRKVYLFLPKFKLETGYDLVGPFTGMGMKDAFAEGKADFRGMGWPKGDLWIYQIKHKAVVEVNEEGTEAAGATAVEMTTKSAHYDPVFRADHPFLFLIRDNKSGAILFMGRMANPGK